MHRRWIDVSESIQVMQWKMKYRQALYVNTDDIHIYDVWKDDVSISQLIDKGDAWKEEVLRQAMCIDTDNVSTEDMDQRIDRHRWCVGSNERYLIAANTWLPFLCHVVEVVYIAVTFRGLFMSDTTPSCGAGTMVSPIKSRVIPLIHLNTCHTSYPVNWVT